MSFLEKNHLLPQFLIPFYYDFRVPGFDLGSKDNSVQFSHVWLFATPWTTACQAFLSITNSRSLLKLMPTESVMPSNRLIVCRPLLL